MINKAHSHKLTAFQSVLIVIGLATSSLSNYIPHDAEALCTAFGAYNMQTRVSGSNVYVLWEYDTTDSSGSGEHDIFFKSSVDYGKTFGEAITLYHSSGKCSVFPHMEAQGDNVYVMWNDDDDKIVFRASNDAGATFGKTIVLGKGVLGAIGSISAVHYRGGLGADGVGNVYAVWNDVSKSNGEIMFAKSHDYGRTFDDRPLNLSNSTDKDSLNPKIAVSGSNVYVVWVDDAGCVFQDPPCNSQVMFAKSADYAKSFENTTSLPTITGEAISLPQNPIVSAVGSHVYLLWTEGKGDVYFSSSNDEGKSFAKKTNLSDIYLRGGRLYSFPQIVASGNDVYIPLLMTVGGAAASSAGGGEDQRYSILKSDDGGGTFSKVSNLPSEFVSAASGSKQFIVTEGGRIYLLWSVFSESERRITFEALGAGGRSLAAAEKPVDIVKNDYVPNTLPPPSNPLLAVSNDTVYVLWLNNTLQQSESPPYYQQIFLRRSSDSGSSFDKELMLTDVTTVPELNLTAAALLLTTVMGGIAFASRLAARKGW